MVTFQNHVERDSRSYGHNDAKADFSTTDSDDTCEKMARMGFVEDTYSSFERRERDTVFVNSYGAESIIESAYYDETSPLLDSNKPLPHVSKYRQLLVLAACWLMNFVTLGINFALGVTYVELIREFNAPRSQAALVQSLNLGLSVGFGFFFTGFINKYGVGVCVIAGSALGAIGMLIGSFSSNIYMAIIFIGVFSGIGMSLGYYCTLLAVSWAFREKKKIALSLLSVASALGQMSMPPLSEYLVEEFRWNGTYLIYSALICNGIVCGLVLYYARDIFNKGHKEPMTNSNTRNKVLDLFKDSSLVLILLFQVIFMISTPVEALFLVDLGILRGYSRGSGALLLSIMGGMAIVGRLFGAALQALFPRLSASVHCIYACLVLGLGHFMVIYFSDMWGMTLGVVLRGVSSSIVVSLQPALQIELRGYEKFQQTAGLVNVAGGICQVASGVIGGAITDVTGSYDLMFYIATGCCCMMTCLSVVMLIWIRRRQNN